MSEQIDAMFGTETLMGRRNTVLCGCFDPLTGRESEVMLPILLCIIVDDFESENLYVANFINRQIFVSFDSYDQWNYVRKILYR